MFTSFLLPRHLLKTVKALCLETLLFNVLLREAHEEHAARQPENSQDFNHLSQG